jgi:hypothetical protein
MNALVGGRWISDETVHIALRERKRKRRGFLKNAGGGAKGINCEMGGKMFRT